MSKNSKNNPSYLNFFQDIQVAMDISVKNFQLVIFFTPKTATTKTLISNLTIKLNLSFSFN